ncbi:uncharacterized protein LOC119433470 isoform X2 [Dermacentor silvarum]|nr:uncharacterized protein LOC119433470 isoform X2 [Dermacentor silvarum]
MVDGQPHLQQVLSQFDDWMQEQGLLQARTVFITFGDWDLQKMLPSQCAYLGIPVPPYMTQWINLKKTTAATWRSWSVGWRPVATGLREPVFEEAELPQEAAVGHDLAPRAHQPHRLAGAEPPAQHEEGEHQRRRAADPLVAVDEHAAPGLGQRTLDEVGRFVEEAVEPEHGHVQCLDAQEAYAGRPVQRGPRVHQAERGVAATCRVQHVRHAHPSQQAHAQRRHTVAQQHAWVHLVVRLARQLKAAARAQQAAQLVLLHSCAANTRGLHLWPVAESASRTPYVALAGRVLCIWARVERPRTPYADVPHLSR